MNDTYDFDKQFSPPAESLHPGRRVVDPWKKDVPPRVTDEALADLLDPASWGYRPVRKRVLGKEMTLYTFGALAKALERPFPTLRQWEMVGHIPPPPIRAEHLAGPLGRVGRRYYTQQSINTAQMEFYRRGILGSRRIDWSEHQDLGAVIAEKWNKEIEDLKQEQEK